MPMQYAIAVAVCTMLYAVKISGLNFSRSRLE